MSHKCVVKDNDLTSFDYTLINEKKGQRKSFTIAGKWLDVGERFVLFLCSFTNSNQVTAIACGIPVHFTSRRIIADRCLIIHANYALNDAR